MKFKLNDVIYNKLYLQAQEARDQGLTRIASGITKALSSNGLSKSGANDIVGDIEMSGSQYNMLKGEVYNELWNLSSMIMSYYDLESVDAKVLDVELKDFVEKFVKMVEDTVGVDSGDVGDCEELIPGEE